MKAIKIPTRDLEILEQILQQGIELLASCTNELVELAIMNLEKLGIRIATKRIKAKHTKELNSTIKLSFETIISFLFMVRETNLANWLGTKGHNYELALIVNFQVTLKQA